MLHVLEHAIIDSLKVLAISIIINIILSFFEGKISKILGKKSSASPLIGTAAGLIPQCGVPVVAADLYQKEHITAGTLLAIFFACSDEALPILFSKVDFALYVIPLLLIKFVFGFILGYCVNLFIKRRELKAIEEEIHTGCCGHHIDDEHESKWHKHLFHPFLHSLKILFYVFIINFIFGTIIHFVGEDAISNFLVSNLYISPIIAGIIGLVPNCASSVVISELFISGGLPFGALVTGLCVNAGLGMIYLFKFKEIRIKVLKMLLLLFVYSIIIGYLTILIMNLF